MEAENQLTQVEKNAADEQKEQASKRAGDWILELFAPTYAHAADVLEGKHEEEDTPRVKIVSAFDPQSIKDVYDRVHMMIKMDEELKKQKAQAAEAGEAECCLVNYRCLNSFLCIIAYSDCY